MSKRFTMWKKRTMKNYQIYYRKVTLNLVILKFYFCKNLSKNAVLRFFSKYIHVWALYLIISLISYNMYINYPTIMYRSSSRVKSLIFTLFSPDNGLGLIKTPEDKAIRDEGYKIYAFNTLASIRIGDSRIIPDTRNKLYTQTPFNILFNSLRRFNLNIFFLDVNPKYIRKIFLTFRSLFAFITSTYILLDDLFNQY